MRVVDGVGSLRRRKMYRAVREATIIAALRERFRIVHVSLQRTHVHMLVEAKSKDALARGMQGFQISAARNINTVLAGKYGRRRGKVFADRYHAEVITSPTRARRALSYVNNWRKHGEDQQGLARTWLVDPFSSGILFPGWQELESKDFMWPMRETYDPLVVRRPESLLLREGWKLCGSISARDVPSSARDAPGNATSVSWRRCHRGVATDNRTGFQRTRRHVRCTSSWPMRTLSLVILVAVSACSDATDRLEAARDRWRHAAIADYSFAYRTTGFAARVAVAITVRGGAVTNVADLGDTGFTLSVEHAPTIDALIDRVEEQLGADDVDVRVSWDAELGFPANAYFDGGEEGDGFTVSAFRSGS
jgi:REP element-mobilizing transposase RayT